MRYIDYALDYCNKTDEMPDYAKFRWSCESAWVTREYLRSRPIAQIERLKKRIAEGRIEVTGMLQCRMMLTELPGVCLIISGIQSLTSVQLKPYEVRFIEVEF